MYNIVILSDSDGFCLARKGNYFSDGDKRKDHYTDCIEYRANDKLVIRYTIKKTLLGRRQGE